MRLLLERLCDSKNPNAVCEAANEKYSKRMMILNFLR